MARYRLRLAAFLPALPGIVGLILVLAASPVRAAAPVVYVLPAEGAVDNVLAGYISDGVARAANDGASAVVVELNTPGGALDSTQRIVSNLLDAKVPTIVWVAPSGGRAASAGTFITLAANLAFMAPGTNIGAASPVGGNGEDIPGTLGQKVKNDAIANIRSIAEARHRNVDWAVSTVADAHSSPASEAVQTGAVDGIAVSIDDVLRQANGKTVTVAGQPVTLDLAGAQTQELAMNPFQAFLHLLSDPNIAFLLFTLGFYGLLFELQSPNAITGILGGLAIVLAFIGFGSLPLNVAGLLLLALGIVLFALDLTVTSHGVLTLGGLVCFVLGASALYTVPGNPLEPAASVATPLLAVVSLAILALMAAAVATVVRSRRRLAGQPASGSWAGLVAPGTIGEVRYPLTPIGMVYAEGEEWTARPADEHVVIQRGTPVRVVGHEGLTLIVEPAGLGGSGA